VSAIVRRPRAIGLSLELSASIRPERRRDRAVSGKG
jgi:hypothetical protein